MLFNYMSRNLLNSKYHRIGGYRCIYNLRSELFLISQGNEKREKKSKNDNKSISSFIMENNGFVVDSANGLIINLPLGKRIINKLINVVRDEMNEINGQEIEMPALSDINLWKLTERDKSMGSELFKLFDRHNKQYCLCPTHEEIVTNMFSKLYKGLSSSCFSLNKSLRLYQITRKYRDESRPKHTLLRAREFLMKDMYSFHLTDECAQNTYHLVGKSYEKLLKRLDIKFIKAKASVGSMGGNKSHEFLVESEIGEDKIYECYKCKRAISSDLMVNLENSENMISKNCCGTNELKKQLNIKRCIEIGHTFL